MTTPTRIIMFGTGDFALPTFQHLIETGHSVVALVTQPDRPQGRKQVLVPSRIKLAAEVLSIPIEQPEDVNAPDALERIRALEPDLFVTAAYGQILSPAVLSIPRLGGINLHGSLLPAYRGAAPVARAIQSGETETGVTVILMTARIDAGGMIAIARTPIDPDETAGELEDRLALLGRASDPPSRRRLDGSPRNIFASRQNEGHAGRQASQRRWVDRLVTIGQHCAQPCARHATLARCIHHVASSTRRISTAASVDHPQNRGR